MEKNIARERAIQTIEGQVLLISCPGSGKTTTIIRRIKAMIDSGINSSHIVMVTFTDAAATEMRERFFKQYGACNAAKLDFFIADAEQYSSTDEWLGKAIILSTMHRAKGLEWDAVFIIDCCHGSIPISKAKLKSEIEEERRLFYVAVTRAKEALYLLNYSQKPGSKEKVTQVKPSEFLKEMKGNGHVRTLKN